MIHTGSTGSGKSFVVFTIVHHACALGFSVPYQHSIKLHARKKIAKANSTYLKELSRIERQQVLTIDVFGIQVIYMHGRLALMKFVEDRLGKSSTILFFLVPVS